MSNFQVGKHFIVEGTSELYQVGSSFINENAGIVETTSGLQFSQVAVSSLKVQTVNQTLQFSDSKTVTATKLLSSGLSFSHTVSEQPSINETASNVFQFSHSNTVFSTKQFATNGLQFSDTVSIEEIFSELIAHGLQFNHVLQLLAPQAVTHTLQFSQLAGGGITIPGGLDRSATQTVQFSHSVANVLCLAIATTHSVTHGLQFNDGAFLPLFFTIPDAVIFSEAATANYIHNIEEGVEFGHVLGFNGVWDRTLTQGLQFSHAFGLINKIDLCRYSPSIGANTDLNAPTPPPAVFDPVVKASQVTLFYPTVTPTSSVIIRAPEYGDRHRLQFDRINRETRGGTLEVFADPEWPKLEVIEASFTGLKESEAQAILDFFTLTLGQEVGFTDWHGRTWHGIVMTPDTQLIRARRSIVDLSFEFEGEVQ